MSDSLFITHVTFCWKRTARNEVNESGGRGLQKMKMNEPGRQKLERQKCVAVGKARTLYSDLLDQASQRDL